MGLGVDIVMPFFNGFIRARRAVESCLATTGENPLVVNDSVDPTESASIIEFCNHHGILYMQPEANQGYLLATMAGARHGDEPWILFMNSDLEFFEPNWLQKMLAVSVNTAIVGARLLFAPDHEQFGLIQHAGVYVREDGQIGHNYMLSADCAEAREVRDVNAVTGTLMLVRRSVWDELGGWDRNFCRGGLEDIDFCWRARAAGYRVIYRGDAAAYHWQGACGDGKFHPIHSYMRPNMEYLAQKWQGKIPVDIDQRGGNSSPTPAR